MPRFNRWGPGIEHSCGTWRGATLRSSAVPLAAEFSGRREPGSPWWIFLLYGDRYILIGIFIYILFFNIYLLGVLYCMIGEKQLFLACIYIYIWFNYKLHTVYIFIFPDAQRLICNSVGFFFACFFQVTLWRINVEVLKPRGLMMDRPLQICPSEKKKNTPWKLSWWLRLKKRLLFFGKGNSFVETGIVMYILGCPPSQ